MVLRREDDMPPETEPMPQILHRDNAAKGAFYVELEGRQVAELAYTNSGTTMIISHTEVGDELRGRGVGKRLVEEAVRWARERKLTIIPLCPFAAATFERNPSLRDVLAR